MKSITIFTPTYNRSNYLKILYESLVKQSNKNFIWLIIDDGSTDGTESLIKEFIKEDKILINYIYQENSGKYIAHNKAVLYCNTEFFMCVDSDDYLDSHAIEWLFDCIEENKKSEITFEGIVAPRHWSNGKITCKNFPKKTIKTKICILNDVYRIKGETVILFVTEVLKKYKIPKFLNEKFASEEILYNQFDATNNVLTLNKPICYMEYLNDGLTKNIFNTWLQNPMSTEYLLHSRYNTTYGIKMLHLLNKRIKTIIFQGAVAIALKNNPLEKCSNKILMLLLLPFSVVIKFRKFN